MTYAGRADGRFYDLFPTVLEDPPPFAGGALIYCKVTSGVGQLWVISPDGTKTQLSPASALTPVSSVFGRIGAVLAAANDYVASLIGNDSSVPGAFVKDALNALLAASGVTSVFSRTGAVTAQDNDYTTSQIQNVTGLPGLSASNVLLNLDAKSGVTSVFSRTLAVVAAANDYVASLIGNDSSVAGTFVKDALNTLNTAIAGKAPIRLSVASISGAKTLTSADANVLQQCTAATVITVNNAVFQAGDVVPICQYAAGAVSFAGTATMRSRGGLTGLNGQYAYGALVFLSATEYLFVGDRA